MNDSGDTPPSLGRRLATYALIGVGFLQIAGWLLGSQLVMGLGFMTNASPLPLVFSDFRGIEPFSSTFEITLTDTAGKEDRIPITPETYAQLEGPYNLRNVYGAVFAGGPKLESPKERALWESIMRFGFCDPGLVAKTFGYAANMASATVTQTSRARGIDGTWQQEIACLP